MTTLDSWSSLSEKTVFILDRGPYFTQVSSGHSINGDFLNEAKKLSQFYKTQPNIKPIDRSLWTCTVEAVVGYSRLVWDLFTPDQKCISILSVGPYDNKPSDNTSESTYLENICTWQDDDQNLDHLLKKLGRMSYMHQVVPPKTLISTDNISSFPNCIVDSTSIKNSLDEALTQIAQLTPAHIDNEEKIRQTGHSITNPKLNNGRIIIISSFQNAEAIQMLLDNFEKMLTNKNDFIKKSSASDQGPKTLAQINYCDLVIVNTYPITDTGPCSRISSFSCFRPNLHCKTYSVKSGRMIAGLLNNLCLQHYNLKSTTITGIPMKEEQNSKSSSQYDVEIVHCSSVHEDILASDSPLLEGVMEKIDRNGFPCDTFKLSWCTPRTTAVELNHCVAVSRITSVDVNSRPSACLTNFLLSGRTVMLEIFKSKNMRVGTHILASHNGELYIHSLSSQQQQHQGGSNKLPNSHDVPPISESLGGRVTDYRINDFVEFMWQNTFSKSHITDNPSYKTSKLIKRQTLYWPLSLGHTILLNVPQLLGPLLKVIPKENLNQFDIDQSKAAIDQLMKYEKESHALPSVSIVDILKHHNNGGGSNSQRTKLSQLYKLFWNELEYFLRVHSTTGEHEMILEYLLERRHKKSSSDSDKSIKRPASKLVSGTGGASSSAAKRLKSSQQVIPELNLSNPAVQQSLVLLKTGVSLWSAWSRLYNENNRHRKKLPFVGRFKPPKTNNNMNTNINPNMGASILNQ